MSQLLNFCSMSPAQQCKTLKLEVGDTIIGSESCGDWHSTASLTLIWLGKEKAVWSVSTKNSENPIWTKPTEECNWNLAYRKWEKIGNFKS